MDPRLVLYQELATDPKQLGFAAIVPTTEPWNPYADQAAALLNDKTGPGAEMIAITSLPKREVMKALRLGMYKLGSGSADIQAKYQYLLRDLDQLALDDLVDIDDDFKQIMAGMVADGLVTQDRVTAMASRIGSRYEVLFVAGAVCGHWEPIYAFQAAGKTVPGG